MADAFTTIAGKPQIVKDPNAVLDSAVDLEAGLLPTADTISSATVTGSGVTIDSSGVVGGTAVTMWVSGGAAGSTGSATVRITTAAGRIDDRTIYFKIKER